MDGFSQLAAGRVNLSMMCLRITIKSVTVLLAIGAVFSVWCLNSCEKLPEGFFHITTDTVYTYIVEDGNCCLKGTIVSMGELEITDHGFCWSETGLPVANGPSTRLGSKRTEGPFTCITGDLASNTTYHIRAFAATNEGIKYGQEKIHTTCAPHEVSSVTDFESNIYQTIIIGQQTWMAENLRVTHYADGTPIELVESSSAWAVLDHTTRAYCFYDNSEAIAENYGVMYNWAAATNVVSSSGVPSGIQGVCPDGWHLPSDGEWKVLEVYLGMNQTATHDWGYRGTDEGGKLKETGTNNWVSPNRGATNETGFKALAGGYRFDEEGWYLGIGWDAKFWSATENSDSTATHRFLYTQSAQICRYSVPKNYGLSVRCVKDD